MTSPPFSVAVHYGMGQELENGLAGRRTGMDSPFSAPPDLPRKISQKVPFGATLGDFFVSGCYIMLNHAFGRG